MPEKDTKKKRDVRPLPVRMAEAMQRIPVMREFVSEIMKADPECAALLRDKLTAALNPTPASAAKPAQGGNPAGGTH